MEKKFSKKRGITKKIVENCVNNRAYIRGRINGKGIEERENEKGEINERDKRKGKKEKEKGKGEGREEKGTYKQKAYTQRLISFRDGTVPHVGGRQSVRGRGLSMVVAVGFY